MIKLKKTQGNTTQTVDITPDDLDVFIEGAPFDILAKLAQFLLSGKKMMNIGYEQDGKQVSIRLEKE